MMHPGACEIDFDEDVLTSNQMTTILGEMIGGSTAFVGSFNYDTGNSYPLYQARDAVSRAAQNTGWIGHTVPHYDYQVPITINGITWRVAAIRDSHNMDTVVYYAYYSYSTASDNACPPPPDTDDNGTPDIIEENSTDVELGLKVVDPNIGCP